MDCLQSALEIPAVLLCFVVLSFRIMSFVLGCDRPVLSMMSVWYVSLRVSLCCVSCVTNRSVLSFVVLSVSRRRFYHVS